MTRHRRGALAGLAILLGACAAGVLSPSGGSGKDKDPPPRAAPAEPGGTTEAAGLAANQSDEYAWRLFLFINRQARPGLAGAADPDKATVKDYDADRDVVWETWALASAQPKPNGLGNEVFLAKGAKPVAWDKLPRANGATKELDHTFTAAGQQLRDAPLSAAHPGTVVPFFAHTDPASDEVRVNRATFDTIRDNDLYSIEGLADAFKRAAGACDRDYLQFPPAAKIVKARWQPITEADKPRYHWRMHDGTIYGLIAFHVTTKDLPFWFWCDFIHADLVPKEPPCSMHDTTTRGPGAAHGKDGERAETAGSKWRYYRLKGSQTAFTDARGTPTVLGNQLLEAGNAAKSSCISCHAMAGIDKGGKAASPPPFRPGLPQADVFGDKDILRLQTDFIYSFHRAHSTKE